MPNTEPNSQCGKESEVAKYLTGTFTYDSEGQYIWLKDSKDSLQKIADLRGWGNIQNMFRLKSGWVDEEKAAQFQDKVGEHIVNMLNDYAAAKSEVESLTAKLEACKVGLNELHGKYAEDYRVKKTFVITIQYFSRKNKI